MATLIMILHYIVCFFLIIIILLQAGKGANIGAVFGGGGSQTVFGGRGPATILNKITVVIASLFLVLSIAMAHITKSNETSSVIQDANITDQIDINKQDSNDDNLDKNKATKEKAPDPK